VLCPCETLVPRVENLVCCGLVSCHDDKATVVADFVYVRTFFYFIPSQATISREIRIHLILPIRKIVTYITSTHNNSHSVLTRVIRPKVLIGEGVEMKAAILIIAADFTPLRVYVWGLNRLPYASLVKRHYRLDKLTHIYLWDRVFSIDLILIPTLLLALIPSMVNALVLMSRVPKQYILIIHIGEVDALKRLDPLEVAVTCLVPHIVL